MSSTFSLKRIFFLVLGVIALYFYYKPSQEAEANLRTEAQATIDPSHRGLRQGGLANFLEKTESSKSSEDCQVILEEENHTQYENKNEEFFPANQDQEEIDRLQKELKRTQADLQQYKEAKEQATEQALKIKEDLQITHQRYQAQNATVAYMSDILAQINPFRKLGLYEAMPKEYYNYQPGVGLYPNKQYYGIKHNPGYCDAVDLYNLKNPGNVFERMNFITDYSLDESLAREQVIKKIGNDVMPKVWMGEQEHQKPKYDLAINGTMYFFKRVMLHSFYEINKDWACLSQMYNHIPGNGVLTRKDLLVETVNAYTQKYANKPQCIQEDKFFPHAFRLDIKSECSKFFEIINSDRFLQNKLQEPIQYLIKQGYGAHRASGLYLMDEEFELQVRDIYKNGELCGVVKKPWVAQKYISNPLLLDKKNKFDFRIYMLVASVDPLIVYYHDGFLRVSLSQYDKFSKEKNVHFTNTHLSKELFKKARDESQFDGMTEEELRDYQMWSMEELEAYLLETGKINDTNWLANYLRPKFKEAFVHIARMAENSFYKSPSVFEMYGLDFVVDEDLNIWLIECNASPQLVGTSEKKSNFLTKMLKDLFEIEYSYLRSRMKRVHDFINKMEKKSQLGEELDYQEQRKQFDQININKLETEFEISLKNSFVKILDQNLKGPEAYFGHIDNACLN